MSAAAPATPITRPTGRRGAHRPGRPVPGADLAGGWNAPPHNCLREVLSRWAAADHKPLVLLIDEIDALVGDTLIAVLRQLRTGYARRPRHFPQSVILCGVRDVRDYRIRSSSENAVITGAAPSTSRSATLNAT